MKIYPITNGTPDNSLEFIVTHEPTARYPWDNPKNIQKVIGGGDGMRFSEEGMMSCRVLIIGPAFTRLLEMAGKVDLDIPAKEFAEALFGMETERARTAAELCEWLEERGGRV